MRHADAGDRDEFARTGRPDDERPLSPKGHRQMRDGLPGLMALVPGLDHIITSPFVRARETAELIRKGYDAAPLVETPTLEPEAHPKAFSKWLRERELPDLVACVGHEPHLSGLVAWLTNGDANGFVDFKKGGACLVTFDDSPDKAAGYLRWLLGPKELAALQP